MKKAYLTTNTCISAVSLIFFENIFQNFEWKMLSTFSTLSTNLVINQLRYVFVLIQSSTFFYKTPILTDFSTFFYDFYTLIENLYLQIVDNVRCRKLTACRKCRTVECVFKTNINTVTSIPTNPNTFAR